MIDPVKVLEHFTNFGQRGHNYGGFPVRCFARYRFDDDYEHWRSFWERSRNSEQIEKERDYKWKDDEELIRVAHAEHYVLKRMKNIFNTRRDTVRKAENYQTKDLFDKYDCYPRILHCYYANGQINTILHQQGKHFA